jgi:ubiquinone/menaquinone biosynthesis C-methylase UbiE
MATMDSNIVDIGCGCGRYAMLLSRYEMCGQTFQGQYTGIDLDGEMVEWCREHFAPKHFRFHHANVYNRVYNPAGEKDEGYCLPPENGSQHFVFCNSLYTHLLEAGVRQYVNESYRVLTSGGWMQAVVCCVDTQQEAVDGRWTLAHRNGNAFVESVEYPEAAVAYPTPFLLEMCKDAGFEKVSIVPDRCHSLIRCRK